MIGLLRMTTGRRGYKEEVLMKGKFILIEGGDGSGKSTIVRYLASEFRKRKVKVVTTREPGGSKVAEGIREAFINTKLSATTQLFCFIAARSAWVEQVLKPKLEKGNIVLCDRSYPSTYVYQGIAGGLGLKKVADVCKIAMQNIKPDVVIILDVDHREGLKRSHATGEINALEKAGMEFHKKVNSAYRQLAKKYHWKLVDANQPLEKVKIDTYELVNKCLK